MHSTSDAETLTRPTITAVEFERIADQLGPCELVRGEVVELPPAGFDHSRDCANIAFRLTEWARRTKRGRVICGEAGLVVAVDPDTVRGADVAFLSYERLPRGTKLRGFLRLAPELIVEVAGAGQGWGTLVEKAGEYLQKGVDRVWIVDPDRQRVHVFRADAAPAVFSETDALRDDAVLPGFECPVAEFFED